MGPWWGGSLAGMVTPERILQIKGKRERKTGEYTPSTPSSGSWLVGTWQMEHAGVSPLWGRAEQGVGMGVLRGGGVRPQI